LRVHGYLPNVDPDDPLAVYGTDGALIRALANENHSFEERLHSRLPIMAAQVIFAARHEMARTIEDVLARRTRMLFLDAAAAIEAAPRVAELMAKELERDDEWMQSQVAAFNSVARGYILCV
jgi:glycerol-3-phosphate dehydrogenase